MKTEYLIMKCKKCGAEFELVYDWVVHHCKNESVKSNDKIREIRK